jgi:hypothetical protein
VGGIVEAAEANSTGMSRTSCSFWLQNHSIDFEFAQGAP